MSSNHSTITESLALVTMKANDLCNTVEDQLDVINEKLSSEEQRLSRTINNAKTQINNFIENDFKKEIPFYRISKNQELKVNGLLTPGTVGTPSNYSSRAGHYDFEIVAYTEHGVEPGNKHPEVQKMWNDLKSSVPKWNQPDFAIIRITAKDVADYPTDIKKSYSFYQWGITLNTDISYGTWIRAESGIVHFGYPSEETKVPTDGRWYERIIYGTDSNGGASYTVGPHFYLSKGASALIALPGVVAGRVPAGRWGYFERPIFEREQ
ncbi:hypothetical protein CWB73_00900 [Pseudoalteromonas phenolica]|uniref:Uncharacterized protein n=1 Tax=Pseudoalteromonas phenolica TaxID=161398 RepID=A0A5S3YYD5_9GAMM|nr:hypothetical protein [Pseudoalteromonas phenolica]TMP83738.1 hypothetical protein CWB73_00900 [Pseudoalteromonas phenolica]